MARTPYRPGVSEVGQCCTTCRFYTWGQHPQVREWKHGYCRAYMVMTDPRAVCNSYQMCPACDR